MSLLNTLFQLISISCKTWCLEYHYDCLLVTFVCFFHCTECIQLWISWSDGEDKTCRIFSSFSCYKSDCLACSDLDQNCGNVDLLEIWWTWTIVIQKQKDVDIHHCLTWCLKQVFVCSKFPRCLFTMSPYYNIFHKFYMGSLINAKVEVCD
jgi:hypothetical protein